MKAYFMVSETDGGLYDTRTPGWHKKPALRPVFQKIKTDCINDSHAIRAAIRTAYAWPGGYELFGITSDGATLCNKCMSTEYRQIAWSVRNKVDDGWRVSRIDCAANHDSAIYCDHCNKAIVDEPEDNEEV